MLKNERIKWLCGVWLGLIVCSFTACSANKIDTSAQPIQVNKKKAAEKNIRIMPEVVTRSLRNIWINMSMVARRMRSI